MTILLFILLLIVSFLVLLYFLRPTVTETAVQQHLESIEENRAVEGDGPTILKRQALSATPWLDELLRDLPGSVNLARLIRQSGQTWQVSSFLLLSLVVTLIVASFASLAIPSIVLGLLLGIAAGSLPYVFLVMKRERRLRQCDAQVPEAVDLMARALRAGHAVPAVIEMVGREIAEPLAGEFRIVHEEQNLGLPLRDAMLNLTDRVPRDDVRFVTTAILLQKETGGNLVESLAKLSAVIRDRLRMFQKVHSLTVEGRVSAWILSLFPFFIGTILQLVKPDYFTSVMDYEYFRPLVIATIVLLVVNIFAMRSITTIKV
jgi:tight adherence protein B